MWGVGAHACGVCAVQRVPCTAETEQPQTPHRHPSNLGSCRWLASSTRYLPRHHHLSPTCGDLLPPA
eukprot:2027093-Rhodomonas_salina.2